MVPTGSEDPLGLRRHAAAIIRLLIEGNIRLDLGKLIDKANNQVEAQGFKQAGGQALRQQVLEFAFERLKYYGRTARELREDLMEAVLRRAASGAADVVNLFAKMQALQRITTRPEFDPLIVGFKRAHRLVEKEKWERQEINPAAFQDPSEGELHRALQTAERQVREGIDRQQYDRVLEALVALKPPIDSFFLGVMVNAEDPALRANRLSLLAAVDRLFLSFADFSQVVVAGSS
jgi:glycyl-tRNA synthetase beta chain